MTNAGSPPLQALEPSLCLGGDDVVQTSAPAVLALARELRTGARDDVEFARAAFAWVRDEVAHSYDVDDQRVTLTATEVLEHRVGLCYAKSHLLAALLRSQSVPTALCYQLLHDAETGGHVLHGLVAMHLEGAWHRQDPRGNKPGVDAQFSLDDERLAWPVDPEIGELDLPQLFASPAPSVVRALRAADDSRTLYAQGLPSTVE
ncbi:transglutaminase family protein [Nocardioides dubius]|uniref:Transglutaminase domain-containing protein n=1 Tax=Nocardioides dubius TaxID=317019 RepID=A0ABP4EG66_9ACTN